MGWPSAPSGLAGGRRVLLVLGTERIGGNDLALGMASGRKELQRGSIRDENDRGLSQRAFDRRELEPKTVD